MICNILKVSALRHERRSVAVSFALENDCLQGTAEVWLGKMSRAIQESVRYNFAFAYFISLLSNTKKETRKYTLTTIQ
jgi:hypothetical protein